MGSSDKHKVCFEVLGEPVITRALETYNLCGAMLNIIVVGMMAENVMATVNQRFQGTVYAFQERPLGTGDAARKGAAILERMRFEGDVLVVAGDKVIAPGVIRQLLKFHHDNKADVTVATARRPPKSSAGILLQTRKGTIGAILEEAECQRLCALGRIGDALKERPLRIAGLRAILARTCDERTAVLLEQELSAVATDEAGSGEATGGLQLTQAAFERRYTADERRGVVRIDGEAIPAGEVTRRFDQMNLSTYIFRAPVLYSALAGLRSNRANNEEYLTDVFEVLARGDRPAKVIGCEIADPGDLMAFNNPQELLAIEEVFRRRRGSAAQGSLEAAVGGTLALPGSWSQMFSGPSAAARKQFHAYYGPDAPLCNYQRALDAFVRRFGSERPVAMIRSPGRINLMGRHIDHQGGTVNVMAINREILVVAAAREDDQVTLANAQGAQFKEQSFRISDLIARLDWDDWQRVVDGPRIQRMLEAARGDWANYVKAAMLRLQELFRDRQLRGLDMMVSGDIPMGAGLSSSSALVVATAEAVRVVNNLPVTGRRLVSLCGEGEWFVGTRGGAADHAAIKLSRRGCVAQVGFFPFKIEASARFFPEHDLLSCNSGVYAGKSSQARNTFNAKVTAYHIGRIWFKMLRPDLSGRVQHLRDINPETLGIARQSLWDLLLQLPERLSRLRVQAAFPQMAPADREQLERLFASHDAPSGGYQVRGVVLFGLSEIARARRCLGLLEAGNATELGRLMRISHDGDRVSYRSNGGNWRRGTRARAETTAAGASFPGHDLRLAANTVLPRERGPLDLAEIPGQYGCSLPELDRIVDLACELPGVEGAQLAGAGLGGCVMVLVRKDATDAVLSALRQQDIQAEVFRPIAGAGTVLLR